MGCKNHRMLPKVTMEEIVFTLKHYWMTADYEPFELYAIA